ncbi:MAG: class I SAM-dependent rRNA methyltransferase [Thermoanaerobaculia bacterium]|nr:class I SAM-dependent rRNA methyltransferase [Thermoanaerobaculia bacterium]
MTTGPGGGERVRIRLAPGREKALRQGHPWLFSGAIAAEEGPAEAALAEVESAGGERLGVGLYSRGSQIRVRMLASAASAIDRAFFRRRLEAARELRRRVVGPDTTGFRLVNAEGDGLPGWTVDRFGEVLVSQITVAGLERLREEAYGALRELEPGCAIFHLGRLPARRLEGLAEVDEVVAGEVPERVAFRELGLELTADPRGGQKTGFYCDQRENRALAASLAGGRRVLDLFAHGGAFALHALRGGAAGVTCVESAAHLEAVARQAVERNGLPRRAVGMGRRRRLRGPAAAPGALRRGDLRPAPARPRRSALGPAARAYKDLNRLALGRLEPGGFLLTFSCSGAIDARLFRQILFAAAAEAGVRVALLRPLAAAADHPVDLAHPQGEYLKGWLAVAEGARLD